MRIDARTFVTCMSTVAILFSSIAAFPSPRNGKIAFTSDRDGNREIYVMNPDGTNQLRLTDNSFIDDYPTWSPDGQKIAFVGKTFWGYSIFVMNSDGTGQREVHWLHTLAGEWQMSLSWSPDGTRIVYPDSSNPITNYDLYTVNVETRNRQQITNDPDWEMQPSWSPDGAKILFARGSGLCSLFTIDPDGTDVEPIAIGSDSNWFFSPKWSPSGKSILFSVGRAEQPPNCTDQMVCIEIDIANPDGSDRRPFLGAEPDSFYQDRALWSPNSEHILFHKWTPESNKELYVRGSGGSTSIQLTETAGSNFNPSWQPLDVEVSISGRVTLANGRGLGNAVVSITDSLGVRRSATTSSFGYYSFNNIPGDTYNIAVRSKRYQFQPRTLFVDDNFTGVDLKGIE